MSVCWGLWVSTWSEITNTLLPIITNRTGLFEIGPTLLLPSPKATPTLILMLSIALSRVDRRISGLRHRLGSADMLSEDYRKLITTDYYCALSAVTYTAVSVEMQSESWA